MKKPFFFSLCLAVILIAGLVSPALVGAVKAYSGIPTIDIVSVVADQKVTIKTNNFPANLDFTVTMGKFGTLGIGGTVVATTNSGQGGSFNATYDIPSGLKGLAQIAIRLESKSSGYYAYDWFTNNTSGSQSTSTTPTATPSVTKTPAPTSSSGYSGYPTFDITGVVKDNSVTITTHNLPCNQKFTVTMGKFGTMGVGGTVVATTDSGNGGSLTVTYSIPDGLKGLAQIAIRMQSPAGYYAYNWFDNLTAGGSTGGTGGPYPTTTVIPGNTVVPTFKISSVVRDSKVTIVTSNLPANQKFTVTMGKFGTLGIGGTVVATTDSGSGGTQTYTYEIPSGLKGLSQIAIRLQSPAGYYAYNWFYNSTN